MRVTENVPWDCTDGGGEASLCPEINLTRLERIMQQEYRRRRAPRMPAPFDAEGRLSFAWKMSAGYRDCHVCQRLCDPHYWLATGGHCYQHSTREGRIAAGAD